MPNDPVPSNVWIPRDVGGVEILWFPIIEFGEPRRALGLARDGQWAWGSIQEGSSEVFPVVGPSVVGLLPLLELSLPMI